MIDTQPFKESNSNMTDKTLTNGVPAVNTSNLVDYDVELLEETGVLKSNYNVGPEKVPSNRKFIKPSLSFRMSDNQILKQTTLCQKNTKKKTSNVTIIKPEKELASHF